MGEIRLGDIIDDYCVKCRRLTNHAVVSIVEGAAAKVRCRTCYHDHDYRHEQAPPSKKDLKKAELFQEVLAAAGGTPAAPAADSAPPEDGIVTVDDRVDDAAEPDLAEGEAEADTAEPAKKSGRKAAKK